MAYLVIANLWDALEVLQYLRRYYISGLIEPGSGRFLDPNYQRGRPPPTLRRIRSSP